MTDTIISSGRGFVIACSDEAHTAVPYFAVDREDGRRNNGFCDLRDQPELVELIEEAQDSSGLTTLIAAANAVGSPFMTIGCDRASFPPDDSLPGQQHRTGAYVDITFRDPAENEGCDGLVDLARHLIRGVEAELASVPVPAETEFTYEMIVEPLKTFFGLDGRYVLTMKPIGFGATEDEARRSFEHAALLLARSLDRLVAPRLSG